MYEIRDIDQAQTDSTKRSNFSASKPYASRVTKTQKCMYCVFNAEIINPNLTDPNITQHFKIYKTTFLHQNYCNKKLDRQKKYSEKGHVW